MRDVLKNAVKGVADAIEAVEVLGLLVRAATFPFRLLARAFSQLD
ncbi:hypothetical protein [Cellulomonas sp. NS3]|nr:hypothetical protein [Cellulomonas sp. NS3]